MITDSATLQAACSELFACHPQAARPLNNSGTSRSIVLLQAESGNARFFILISQDDGEGPFFSIRRWCIGGAVDLDDETAPVPGWAVNAVTHGVPLPRDGSLYGWADRGRITAMVAFSTQYTPEVPEPSWSLMPDADLGEENWPPFADERLVGPWLWEHFQAGHLVDLASLVASSENAVFWVDTAEAIGSGSIAVAHDLASPDGWTFPRGRYVYCQHRDGAPSLDDLLADPGKTDLAPRFREF
jgi:hypothetical protein